MKMIFILLFFCNFCLLACKPKEPVNPSSVEEAKMIAIMTDVYYMDSHFSELNSYIKDSIVYLKFKELLVKYGVSESEFAQAKLYYSQNDKAHQRLSEGIKKSVKEASMK